MGLVVQHNQVKTIRFEAAHMAIERSRTGGVYVGPQMFWRSHFQHFCDMRLLVDQKENDSIRYAD